MAGKITVSTINDSSGVLATQNGMTGIPKAWVTFNGSTATVNGSFNVSSVTRNAGGDYTVNMTTAMANANYAYSVNFSPVYSTYFSGGTSINAATSSITEVAPTTSAFRFVTYFVTAGQGSDSKYINVIVCGA